MKTLLGAKLYKLKKGYVKMKNEKDIQEDILILEEKIAELKSRMPAHSIPVTMLQELEDLEEALDTKKKALKP